MTDYTALEDLLGHLHQDWALDYETVWDVLSAYLDDLARFDGAEQGRLVAEDIRRLLSDHSTEDELAEQTLRLGAYYVATWGGGTYRSWLTETARRIEQWLATQPLDPRPPHE